MPAKVQMNLLHPAAVAVIAIILLQLMKMAHCGFSLVMVRTQEEDHDILRAGSWPQD